MISGRPSGFLLLILVLRILRRALGVVVDLSVVVTRGGGGAPPVVVVVGGIVRQWCPSLKSGEENLVNQVVEIHVGRSSWSGDSIFGDLLPFHGFCFHPLPILSNHEVSHKPLHFLHFYLSYLHAQSPVLAKEPTVCGLLCPSRPTYHWNSSNNTFKNRIPAAMGQEPSNRWMSDDFLLRRPSYNSPLSLISASNSDGKIADSPNTKSGLIAHIRQKLYKFCQNC
ncbi:hypothetical protein RHGRI_021559 [Rhododendron griersonianum]|uniref:Uncharacterized protein n=1 Tax=Rhododendron griersonianum TaxID=479676 RepID=A0AAV6JKN2_9ERIC|nr:hypothetical protein RHGRI_021559 [Rhododendron griersonianum]